MAKGPKTPKVIQALPGPTSRKGGGVSGVAVLLAAGGLYLVYVGVKDVPVVEGLRDLIRGRSPVENAGAPYVGPIAAAVAGAGPATAGVSSTDSSTSGHAGYGLVGNAAAGLPKIQRVIPAGTTLYGRAERPDNPTSDHPKGLALDVMTTDPAVASRVIRTFKGLTGAKYWIWNRQIGSLSRLWVPRAYTGEGAGGNPHTDHVHLSWS